MIDLESRIAVSLQDRADRGKAIDGLHDRAVVRAGRIRRRRRAASVAAAAGLAAVLTAGIATAPRLLSGGGAQDTAHPKVGKHVNPAPDVVGGPTTLPTADGVLPAAQRPLDVGTDAAVLHFDMDLKALGATDSRWTSSGGYEGFVIPTASGGRAVEAYLGPDASVLESKPTPPGIAWWLEDGSKVTNYTSGPEERVTINGRPGKLQKITAPEGRAATTPPAEAVGKIRQMSMGGSTSAWVLRWSPIEGLHAIVQVNDRERGYALAVAQAMRLDRAQWCAVPVRITAPPAGATVTLCETAIRQNPIKGRGVWAQSSITMKKPGGGTVNVWLEDAKRFRHSHDTSQFHPTYTVAGHPAAWLKTDPKGLWVLNFGPSAEVFVSGTATVTEALRIGNGLKISADLFHPETWPQRPIG